MVRVRYSFSSRRTGHIKNIRKQKKKIPNLVREIVEVSDIILEILDARFLQETRNKELEELIKHQGKKILYVINKTDLVDLKSKVLEVSSLKIFPYIFVSCKKRSGVSKLRNKIKIEAKKLNITDRKVQVEP
jgi:ribosome biogenesis GTPase A